MEVKTKAISTMQGGSPDVWMKDGLFQKQFVLNHKLNGEYHEPSSNRMGGEESGWDLVVIDDDDINKMIIKRIELAKISSYLGKWHRASVSFSNKDEMKQRISSSERKWDAENKTWKVFITKWNHDYFNLRDGYVEYIPQKIEDDVPF